MLTHPVRKSIPTAKLTTDNAGDVELTAHRRAIAAAAAPQPQSMPPTSSLLEPMPEPTSATATDSALASDQVDAPTSTSTKQPRPRPLLPTTSLETLADDTDLDEPPKPKKKTKKTKATPCQAGSGLQTEVSIIEIDDGDSPHEPLNKVKRSVDIEAFFIEIPSEPGQDKTFVKCDLCV